MQPTSLVLLDRPRAGVARITLNRPEALNALSPDLVGAALTHVRAVQADAEVKAVVLTGAGRAFCSGAELKRGNKDSPGSNSATTTPRQPRPSPGAQIEGNMKELYNPLMEALYGLNKPLVVALNGVAAGGGVGLALVGDIVLASDRASIVCTFAPKLGLVPDLGSTWTMPRLAGRARTMGLALLGETLSAQDAFAAGLVYKVVAHEALEAEALRVASRLADGPTHAFAAVRRVVDASWSRDFVSQLALEAQTQRVLADRPEYMAGVKSFRSKKNASNTESKL